MPQILVGALPDDGTGDTLRAAGLKINQWGQLNDKTVNAAFYKTSGLTTEAALNLAIPAAALLGAGAVVWVPASMLPYNAALVTFNTGVRMACEARDPNMLNIKAYGAYGDGTTDDIASFTAMLAASKAQFGLACYLPNPSVAYLISSSIFPFEDAGTQLIGESMYRTIIRAKAGFTGTYMIGLQNPNAGTTAYNQVLSLFLDLNGQNLVGIDLSSVNNANIHNINVQGGTNFATRIGTGIRFNAPLLAGAYNNELRVVRVSYCTNGILWDVGAHQNMVLCCAAESCGVGLNAAPAGLLSGPKALFTRVEACDKGVLEGATNGCWVGIWFEASVTSDIEYTASSIRPYVVGHNHAVSPAGHQHFNFALATTPIIDDMSLVNKHSQQGVYGIRTKLWVNQDPTGTPGGVSGEMLYLAGGRAYIDSQQWYMSRNAAGTGQVFLISADSGDDIQIGSSTRVYCTRRFVATNVVALTDAATVVVDAGLANYYTLLTTAGVGATRAIGAPSTSLQGQRIAITIIQDAIGGRAVTWNAVFKVSWSDAGNTANKRSTVTFINDGTNWNQIGAQSPYV